VFVCCSALLLLRDVNRFLKNPPLRWGVLAGAAASAEATRVGSAAVVPEF